MLKTVLVDNSLCVSTLRENASAEDISGYLTALGKAGIRYAELDFRTLMKLRELPKGIGYIFRAVDPTFMSITEAFSFDYVVMTFADLKKDIKTKLPVMLEMPFVENTYKGVLRYAQAQTNGMVTAIRFCDDFGFMDNEQARRFVSRVKNTLLLPVDFCPRNIRKTALDAAVKLSMAGADSLTQTMPATNLFSSLEEYAVSLLSIYDTIPRGFDFFEFFGAVFYYRKIFKNSDVADIMKLFDRLAWDIRMMKNADTGEKTRFNIALKNTGFLKKKLLSSLEKKLLDEDLDGGEYETLLDAVRHFDTGIASQEALYGDYKGLLN